MPVANVMYNILCAKLKPNLHLTMVTKNKTILLYAITQGIKFDVGHVIERRLIDSTKGHCTGAVIHPLSLPNCVVSLRYRCWSLRRKHIIDFHFHYLNQKLETSKNMEDKDEEEATTAEKSEEDSKDEDLEVDLLGALQSVFSRLSTR